MEDLSTSTSFCKFFSLQIEHRCLDEVSGCLLLPLLGLLLALLGLLLALLGLLLALLALLGLLLALLATLLALLGDFFHVARLSPFGDGGLMFLLLPFKCLHLLLVALRDPTAHLLLAGQPADPRLLLHKSGSLAVLFVPQLREVVALPATPQANTTAAAHDVCMGSHAIFRHVLRKPLRCLGLLAHTLVRSALLDPFASLLQEVASLGLAE